ncbi:MAG: response regulator transcription factor [Deltaproteobacteria bacterium]|nr:response regulator transcription factor [Deltaproteobacteria bacterium]
MQRSVLVVDDDRKLADGIRRYLERDGFRVLLAHDALEALRQIDEAAPSLVVLDLMLPQMDGLEVCRRVRAHSLVPIIMVTARSLEDDKLAGLEVGADDYVTKPFSPRELVARVHAVLRRSTAPGGSEVCLRFGGLEVDGTHNEVRYGGRALAVTRSEQRILMVLASNVGRTLSRERLGTLAFGHEWQALDRTLDAHIMKLRRKLEPTGFAGAIETVFGIGYRFNPPVRRDA